MKKLLTLTFALLFTVGIAFGQSTNIKQVGNYNEANIQKAGPISNVDATIAQVGDYNDALMKPRYGADNVSMTIRQRNGNRNEAYLRVTTTSNSAYTIVQEGNRNDAEMKVEQNAGSANSWIRQVKGSAGSGFNYATLYLGDKYMHAHIQQKGRRNNTSVDVNGGSGLHNGEGSYVTVRQRGAFNSAKNINIGSNTRLDIDQLGNNNLITSFTVEGNGVYGVSRQLVDLRQKGDRNTITMPGTVTGEITVFQHGNGNTATMN